MNLKKSLTPSGRGVMKVLFRQFPGGTDENHEKPDSG
jgi:hypothetical protein